MTEFEHPLATPADPDALKAIVMAVRHLMGRQALTLGTAWSILFEREHGPREMPTHEAGWTRQVLAEFDYHECLVVPVDGGLARRLWIRRDWPVEVEQEVPID